MDITNKTENKANLNNRELRYNIDDKRSNEEKEGITFVRSDRIVMFA